MRRYSPIYVRIIGGLGIIGGAVLWAYGGKELAVAYKNIVLPLPLELVLICAGLVLALLPLVFFYVLAAIVPFRPAKRALFNFANSLDPELNKLQTAKSPESIAAVLRSHFTRANQRFYLSVPVIIISLSLVGAFLFFRALSRSNSKKESKQLVSLVQESRIDFSSADHIREALQEVEETIPATSVSTARIYDLLKRLYDPSPKDRAEFDQRISDAYETYIRPNIEQGTGLLDTEKFRFKASASESMLAPATYLTLLATICDAEGNQGTNIDPYVESDQLLRLALKGVPDKVDLPATHNALGVSLAGILKTYSDFEAKFKSDPSVAQRIKSELSMIALPSRLALLREAKYEYEKASSQSASNLAKARSLNNQIDILLTSLYLVHIEHKLNYSEIRDDNDRKFMEDELVPQMPNKPWQPQKLVSNLRRWKASLEQSLALAREPEIFFTRAQLYSMGGRLCEQYRISDEFWGVPDTVASAGVSDLSTAASMHLPQSLFDKSRAEHLFLDWLWTRPNVRPALQKLSSETETVESP